jgi:hypothetical protein
MVVLATRDHIERKKSFLDSWLLNENTWVVLLGSQEAGGKNPLRSL